MRADSLSSVRTSALVGGAGFVLSYLWSWGPSLWTDEAATVSASTRSWSELWAMAHTIDAVHSAYYALMHLWLAVFPATAVSLRLPSALAVGLTTCLLYRLVLQLAPAHYALAAALVFAVLPRTTWMGLEARSSALSTLFAVLASWLVIRYVRTGHRIVLVPYALAVAAGTATHIYLAVLVVAHGISILLTRRMRWSDRWAWFAAAAIGVSVAVPVIIVSSQQTGQLGGADLSLTRLLRSVAVNQWFLGETPTPSQGVDASMTFGFDSLWKPAALALALVAWSLVGLGLVAILTRAVHSDAMRTLCRWWLPWVVLPTALISAYALIIDNLYNPRYFAFSTPALAIAIGVGLVTIRRIALRAIAVVLVALLAVPIYVSQREVNAKSSSDWSAVASHVASLKQPGDGVYFAPRYPVAGAIVGQTSRGVSVAYPTAFLGLSDITLFRTPAELKNLTGSSRRLVDSGSQLAAVDRVFVVQRVDYAYAAQDQEIFSRAGFLQVSSWQGPLDRVVTFGRP